MQIGGAKETKAVSTDSVVSHQYNCKPGFVFHLVIQSPLKDVALRRIKKRHFAGEAWRVTFDLLVEVNIVSQYNGMSSYAP